MHSPMVEVSFIILEWRVDWFHSQSYGVGLACFIHNPTVGGWLVSCTILWWRFHSQFYGGGLAGFIHNPTVESWLVLGFPFAKLLRNFCGTKRKFFLSLRISFARKNNNLCNHSQKSFRAKLPYSTFCETQVLSNSAIT